MNFRCCLPWGGLGSNWREGCLRECLKAILPFISDFPFLETFMQRSANLDAPGFRSQLGSQSISPVVLNSFVPGFLTCKVELVIVLTTYSIVSMNNEMLYAKRLAKPIQVFHKMRVCYFSTKSCRGSLRYLMLKTINEKFFF